MCDEAWTEQTDLLARLMAEQLATCPHCGSANLKHGTKDRSCPPRPYVECTKCGKELV